MTAASFGVLGPIEVSYGDRPVVVGRRKERAVLALLLVAAGRTVSLDRIVDQIWGDEPPDRATSSLHAYISNLRRSLEPDRPPRAPATRLVTRPPGYALLVERDEVDAHRFESLVADAATAAGGHAFPRANELLTTALGLWRGPAYGEFGEEPFALAEVLRLDELRATAVEDRLDVRLELGAAPAVAAEAESVVAVAPTRERAWGQLMVALYRSGRQADALRAFQRARDAPAESAGIDPGPDLRRLESQILAQDPELVATSSPAREVAHAGAAPDGPAAETEPAGHRPADPGEPSDRLVGRRRELELLDRELAETRSGRGRVVLLSGEAGVGKTAVATELGRRAVQGGLHLAATTWPETLDRPELAPWVHILEQLGGDAVAAANRVREALIAARTPTVGSMDEVVSAIIDHARANPLVVVFDDVQWASELSHLVLRQLVERAPEVAMLVVLVRRCPAPDEQPGLLATLAVLGRLRDITRIDVPGLPPDAVIDMISAATQVTPSSAIGAAIHDQTGGNAFYALELGRLLAAEGHLVDAGPLDDMGIPPTVRDVLRRRLDRVPDQAVTLLGIASVLGNEVEPGLLRHVADVSLDHIADQLDLAEAAGFLVRHPTRPGRYRFAHELVRAAILDALPALHAAALHARAIEAITTSSGDHDPRVVHRLARHAVRAAEVLGPEQAAIRIERSALQSRSMLNLDRAASSFRRALTFSEEMSPGPRRDGLRAQLLTRVAQTDFLVDGYGPRVGAEFARALELSERGTPADRVKVLLSYGTHALLFGAIAEAVDAGTEMLAVATPDDEMAITGGRYLAGFDALRHPDPAAERRLVEGEDRDDDYRGVAPTIRAGAAALLDVVDGRSDLGRDRAIDVVQRVIAVDSLDGWIQAWALSFALPALLLADEAATVATLTEQMPQRPPGIAIVDHTITGCRAWAQVAQGNEDARVDLTDARAGLRSRGDALFWLILTLAGAKSVRSMAPTDAREMTGEAANLIDTTGLDGLRPWLAELDRLSGPPIGTTMAP